jgi:chromosomal replication initiator protein
MSSTQNVWQQTLAALELEIDPVIISTWFRNTQIFETSEDKLIVACTDAYSKSVIQKKYGETVEKIVHQILKRKLKIEFIVKPKINNPIPIITGPLFDQPPAYNPNQDALGSQNANNPFTNFASGGRSHLNTQYTLDNFVVGVSNRVVHAATVSVIENPGRIYNPLFIYGTTGVGKTHLLHSVGNGILQHNPQAHILYAPTEKFVNDMIDNIRQKRPMDIFRKKYRDCDALLIDDIQFLSGKESSQEEFYHTFNELHQAGKQLVIASDREPSQIDGLADRLVSRFKGGLMVMISAPDYETRLAIAKTKAEEIGLDITPSMCQYVAEKSGSNIREIQGIILQIKSVAASQNQSVTFELIRSIVDPQGALNRPTKRLTPELILELITQRFESSIKELCGKKRKQEIVIPRHLTMFLLRNELGMNYEEIGTILGGRDHTTIMHGCEKVRTEIEEKGNNLLRSHLASIRQELYA